MRTRVQIVERSFYVNHDKKTVTCVIKTESCTLNHPSRDYINSAVWETHDKALFSDHTFVGIAKCSPLDEFNEEKGKRIAESKAKVKAFKAYNKMYTKVSDLIKNALVDVLNTALACKYASETELKHIKELDNDSKCG